MSARKLASVLGEYLELPNGKMIELDRPEFVHWLEAPENRSFRFQHGFAGEQSFTARKEPSKKGQGDYWYGYRKVDGKLHKRYIGKSEDVTRPRLEEIAVALDTPAPPRAKPLSYINEYVTEETAPSQPPSYIENYVTKEEHTACQQRCKQLEVELEKIRQELAACKANQPQPQQVDSKAALGRALSKWKLKERVGEQSPKFKLGRDAMNLVLKELNLPS